MPLNRERQWTPMRQMARNRQRCFKLEEHAECTVYTCLHNTLRGPFFALMPNSWIYSGATGRFPWSLSLCVPSTDILWVRGTAIRHIRCRPCGDRIPATMSMWSSICVEAVWSVVICKNFNGVRPRQTTLQATQRAMRDLTKKNGALWEYYESLIAQDSSQELKSNEKAAEYGDECRNSPWTLFNTAHSWSARIKACQCRSTSMSLLSLYSSSTPMQTSRLVCTSRLCLFKSLWHVRDVHICSYVNLFVVMKLYETPGSVVKQGHGTKDCTIPANRAISVRMWASPSSKDIRLWNATCSALRDAKGTKGILTIWTEYGYSWNATKWFCRSLQCVQIRLRYLYLVYFILRARDM